MAKISSRKSGIGLIQYSEKKKTQTEIVLGTLSSLKEIKARIDRVEQLRGKLDTIFLEQIKSNTVKVKVKLVLLEHNATLSKYLGEEETP